jgi:hypothetical protein
MEESLKTRLEAGTTELKKLLQDQKRYLMIYNHYYTLSISKIGREKNLVEFERSMYDSFRDCVQISKTDLRKVRDLHVGD